MKSVLVDTGVWYAIFDSRDRVNERNAIDNLASRIDVMSVIIPWPGVYETLRTKFVRNRLALSGFEKRLKSPNIEFIDDTQYKDEAFEMTFNSSLRRHRPLSMVDCVMRLLLDDVAIKVDYLATYNKGDFVDVCKSRRVELL